MSTNEALIAAARKLLPPEDTHYTPEQDYITLLADALEWAASDERAKIAAHLEELADEVDCVVVASNAVADSRVGPTLRAAAESVRRLS